MNVLRPTKLFKLAILCKMARVRIPRSPFQNISKFEYVKIYWYRSSQNTNCPLQITITSTLKKKRARWPGLLYRTPCMTGYSVDECSCFTVFCLARFSLLEAYLSDRVSGSCFHFWTIFEVTLAINFSLVRL